MYPGGRKGGIRFISVCSPDTARNSWRNADERVGWNSIIYLKHLKLLNIFGLQRPSQGGKDLKTNRWRRRKLSKFAAAALSFLCMASCAPKNEIVRTEKIVQKEIVEKEICSHRDFLLELQSTENFEKALTKNQGILSKFPKVSPGDEALFHIGLVYAHSENPKKDYKKSLHYFQKLLNDFPRSPFIQEARMWIGVLNDIERAIRVDVEIEEMQKEITR
jgi:tetratricopeptide (TPR) repeat protein